MTPEERSAQNQAAFRRLKPTIDQTYPRGRFVAIDEGRIVADAPSFAELDAALDALGRKDKEVLVVQAGEDYPEMSYILGQSIG